MSAKTVHLCSDCGMTYDEPTTCEVCEDAFGGRETVPIPRWFYDEHKRSEERAQTLSAQERFRLGRIIGGIASKGSWLQLRLGPIAFGKRIEAEWMAARPWYAAKYKKGKLMRATFDTSLREALRRLR